MDTGKVSLHERMTYSSFFDKSISTISCGATHTRARTYIHTYTHTHSFLSVTHPYAHMLACSLHAPSGVHSMHNSCGCDRTKSPLGPWRRVS